MSYRKKRIANWSLFFCICVVLTVSLVYYYYDKEKYELNDFVRRSSQGKFVKLKNGYVHYELAGPESGELVVLVHGAGSGYYAWDKNFNELANAGYRVLRYDLYGRGLSDRPYGIYDLELFSGQLSELLDSLKLQSKFNLVSVSMGAMIALDYAQKHGDRINRVAFVDPAAINNGDRGWVLKTPLLSDFVMTTYWVPRAVQKQMAEFYKPESVKEYAALSEEHLKFYGLKRAMVSTWLNACNHDMKNELKILGQQNKKILLLWGDHDPLTPIVLSETYLKLMPGSQFYKIENAGHLSNYEQPALVNKYLVEFLKN